MHCAFCSRKAEFKCTCSEIYVCESHTGRHLKTTQTGNHSFIDLTTIFSNAESKSYKKDLLTKIQNLIKAKSQISINTKKFVKNIKNLSKELLQILNNLTEKLINLYALADHSPSDVLEIKRILNTNLKIKPFTFDLCECIKSVYSPNIIQETNRDESLAWKRAQFLKTHSGGFTCGDVSEDGKLLVTGSADTTVRVWDLIEKKHKFVLMGHTSIVKSLILTQDSKSVISGSADTTIRIWNLENQDQKAVLEGNSGMVISLCFIYPTSQLISGHSIPKILIWDFNTQKILKTIITSGRINYLKAFKNSENFISASADRIELWNSTQDTSVRTLDGHSEAVWCLALTKNEETLISGSNDKTICVWTMNTYKLTTKLSGHVLAVFALAFTADDRKFVSGSQDSTVYLWELITGNRIFQFKGHTSIIYSLLPIDNQFISLSYDSTMSWIDIENQNLQRVSYLIPFEQDSEVFIENKKIVAFGSGKKGVVWNLDTEKEEKVLGGHEREVKCIEISKDAEFAITAAGKELVYWDLDARQKIGVLKGHDATVFCVCLSEDATKAASGAYDMKVRLWDLRTFSQVCVFEGHTSNILSIKISANQEYLVSAGMDKAVNVWGIRSKSLSGSLNGHQNFIRKVFIVSGDIYVISADYHDGIKIWNVSEMKLEREFRRRDEAEDWLEMNQVEVGLFEQFLV